MTNHTLLPQFRAIHTPDGRREFVLAEPPPNWWLIAGIALCAVAWGVMGFVFVTMVFR